MELYIETSINLIVRLSREAHEPNTSFKRYSSLANAISNVLNSIEKLHGSYYLHYTAYISALRLGHSLGPINEIMMNKLTKKGCMITKIICDNNIK